MYTTIIKEKKAINLKEEQGEANYQGGGSERRKGKGNDVITF